MTNDVTQEVRCYHVDRVTMTMGLWSEEFQEFLYVEYKGPHEPYIQPVCTLWHEVWPVYHGVTGSPYHIIDWMDNDNGYLDVCDFIKFEAWPDIPNYNPKRRPKQRRLHKRQRRHNTRQILQSKLAIPPLFSIRIRATKIYPIFYR